MKIFHWILIVAITAVACNGRKSISNQRKSISMNADGTYAFDKTFLNEHTNVIELKNGNSALVLVPEYQGRVMTSTCEGDTGFSFGWINYDLIASGKIVEHFNPYGGEERFWLGPEGGQYSIYFAKNKSFDFENWHVPPVIDTESFQVISNSDTEAIFEKKMLLENYSGTPFDLLVKRQVNLLDNRQIQDYLGLEKRNVSVVAYQSANTVVNSGQDAWTKEKGLVSIWMLGMMTPSPGVTVIIPVKEGDESTIGPKVNDDYFGKINNERLKVIDNHIFFKADGKSRGKIGIPPLRAERYMGSYDAVNKTLTILECQLPENLTDYVNSAWELQDEPYGGDAFNSYNDGPLEDGSQMGPFYELETSSPALALQPGESYTHLQRTYHFKGDIKTLNEIANNILGLNLDAVEQVFNN